MADHVPPTIPRDPWRWNRDYFYSEFFLKDFNIALLYELKLARDWAEMHHDDWYKRDNLAFFYDIIPSEGATAPQGSELWIMWQWKKYTDILREFRMVMDREGIEEPSIYN